MRILLVEDDEGLREGLGQLLSEYAQTVEVDSVGAALDALRAESYDLVIADLRLGEQRAGGREVCKAAQERAIPVAILSASTRDDVERTLAGTVPDVLIAKPFQLDEIEQLVVRFGAVVPGGPGDC